MTRVKDDDKDEATERRLARLPPGIQALRGTMKTSFAYVTIKDRLPVILTRAIDALARSTDFCPEVPPIPIIALLSKLKYEMERDRVLEPFPSEPQWALWNAALTAIQEDGVDSWFSAPWLYSECAMV